uniref:Uncharacterized protein n=1 Tax=Panagrolaimus superbus TaxID=310955 RepID=A0A914YVH2_9BILA
MLAQVVSFLTGCADLKNMTLPNRNGALDHKLKHFRRQHLDGAAEHQSPAAKRPKLSATAVGEEIDSISIELNPESDSSALHKLYKSTS